MARRILVIEDEGDVREVVQLSLEMVGGWHALTAASGREGLALAQSEQPDAILLDVMMPDMDGLTTYEKLQANETTRHIPVILLTAKLRPADQQRFAALGVQALIPKPFDPMTLPELVAAGLGWVSPTGGPGDAVS